MACGLFIRVFLLALTSVAATQNLDDGSMMRRQKAGGQQVHLGAGGELLQAKHTSKESYCDFSYSQGTADTTGCIDGTTPVDTSTHCMHAAKVMGLKIEPGKDGHMFLVAEEPAVDGVWSPNPFPKECFMFEGTVRFNPTDTDRTTGFTGTPICQRQTYNAGTPGKDSDVGCTGDYEPIITSASKTAESAHKECLWAHDCEFGGGFCSEPQMVDNSYDSQSAPRGCFRDHQGCFGFNNAETIGTDLTGTKPVCRLKSHVWNPELNATERKFHPNPIAGM